VTLTPQNVRDALGILAVFLIAYGFWLWWVPAGFIAGGASLLGLVIVGTIRGDQPPARRPPV
jgi:hypothetical protein